MNKFAACAIIGCGVVSGIAGGWLVVWASPTTDSPQSKSHTPSVLTSTTVRAIEGGLPPRSSIRGNTKERTATQEAELDSEAEISQGSLGLDPEVEAKTLRNHYEEILRLHRQDWRDLQWAPQVEKALSEQFSTLEGSHSIIGIECKTTSCIVEIEWPTDSEAATGYADFLHKSTEPNCETSFLLEPTSGGAPSRQRLHMNCVDARAEATN